MKIKLTQGKYTVVDNKDFDYLSQWHWFFSSHHTSSGYALRREKQNNKWITISMPRQLLNIPKGKFGDHINGDKLDNRRSNLRIATLQQNNANVGKRNTGKYKGVLKVINRWRANIRFNKKTMHLGSFKNEKEAAIAYNKAARKYFGEFAQLNVL